MESDHQDRFFIKAGYTPRRQPLYCSDVANEQDGVVHQPDVYPFAAFIGARWGCRHIVDIGCGTAGKLAALHPQFDVIGADYGENLEICRNRYPFGTWIEWDLEADAPIPLDQDLLSHSVIICADVIEHLTNPTHLLRNLKCFMDFAPVCLISTPERDLNVGAEHGGPPPNPCHVREWNLEEFATLLRAEGFNLAFIGLTTNNTRDWAKKTILAVVENHRAPRPARAPDDFRVVAVLVAYNEEDLLVQSLQKLIRQGIGVHLIENWSTDSTYELARGLEARGLIRLERFPPSGPSPHYNWGDLMVRVEEVSQGLEADWIIFRDIDDLRKSPWPELSVRDAIYRVDRAGFNCIDHTGIVFQPTDNGFVPEVDFEAYFKHYVFGLQPGVRMPKQTTWKNTGAIVSVASGASHFVEFHGKRIYPYNFLLKHYPVRSQTHGEKKIFVDRKPRWNPQERAWVWHVHYDHIQPGHRFLCSPDELLYFDESHFHRTFPVERLSGIGTDKVVT